MQSNRTTTFIDALFGSRWWGGGQVAEFGAGARWEAVAEATAASDEGAGLVATASYEGTKWRSASAVRHLRQTAAAAQATTTTSWTQRLQEEKVRLHVFIITSHHVEKTEAGFNGLCIREIVTK